MIEAVAMHQTLLILWKLVNILNRICLFDHTNRALVNNGESLSEFRLQPLEVKDSREGQNDDHNGDDPNYARSQEPVLGSVSHILPVDIVRKNQCGKNSSSYNEKKLFILLFLCYETSDYLKNYAV